MQIEWSEGGVLKLAESAQKPRRGPASVWERESMSKKVGKRARRRNGVGSRADGGGAR